jgi:hypothetical protein
MNIHLSQLTQADFAFVNHTLPPIQRAFDTILRNVPVDGQQTNNCIAPARQTIEPPAGEIFDGLSYAEFMF